MNYIYLWIVAVLFTVSYADISVAYIDMSLVMPFGGLRNYTCSADMFSQYLNNVLFDVEFPDDCSTPALDVFSSIDVIYIEEAESFDEYEVTEEMVITGAKTMFGVVSSYNSYRNKVQRYCISETRKGCPRSFVLISNIMDIDFGNKTIIYCPLNSNGTSFNEIRDLMFEYTLLSVIAISDKNNYTETEIIDMNILFVIGLLLVIIVGAAVFAVATIDYGEDTAGLYSKFKQEQSQ